MVTSGGMTKRLKLLADRGFIRREPDPADARVNVVALTAEGKRLVEAVLPFHVANETRLLAGLGEEGRSELAELLARLAVLLGDEAVSAPGASRRRGR
jgi:DNA-binding MarR family transcriptional regulator